MVFCQVAILGSDIPKKYDRHKPIRQVKKTEIRPSTLEFQALSTILASCRARIQFQERTQELVRITSSRRECGWKGAMSEVEAETRIWIDAAESGMAAGAIPPSYSFFLQVYAAETVHERRILDGLYNSELEEVTDRMDAIRQKEGLDNDEFWPIGEGPEGWDELEVEYSQVLDTKFEDILREFSLDGIANLHQADRKTYDARREEGRLLSFEDYPELTVLRELQTQFEAEAELCANRRAYYAALVMVGSAIETALLAACLNRRDDAKRARDRLPDRKRPSRSNPKDWTFAQLATVAGEAGWLPDFEVADGTLRARSLVDTMRKLRNLVHPACHLSNTRVANIELEFENARAAYVLLKRHLARP